MTIKTIKYEELEQFIDFEVESDWIQISYEKVKKFADITGSNHWFHLDVERAKRESPFKNPIVQGDLSLSIANVLIEKCIAITNIEWGTHRGSNKVRFLKPIFVNDFIRVKGGVKKIIPIKNGKEIITNYVVESRSKGESCIFLENVGRVYTV
jgi:acyl dehydratase